MWIVWCLRIVLTVQNCNGQGNPNFMIQTLKSDTLNVMEGDHVTMTCSYTINYNSLNINRGTIYFTWFENVKSEELKDVSQYRLLIGDKSKYIWSYRLSENSDIFDIESSGGSTRFIKRTDTSSSLTIQNVQFIHDGPYVCVIFTEAINMTKGLASDQITLSIYVKPKLVINIQEDWIEENDNATITCSTQRAKPNVTNMVIKFNNADRESSQSGHNQIQMIDNGDKTFELSFSASVRVTRSDNGAAVSCEGTWVATEKNKIIHSNEETLRVVWDIETPKNFEVASERESCIVSWTSDANAKWVTICHELSSGDHCYNVTSMGDSHHVIDQLDPEESYSIWMYASNELGPSDNTEKLRCTPKANGLDIAVVGGAGGGALGLIMIIIIILIVYLVRKKPHNSHDIYSNVDKSKKTPQSSASQPTTNDEENPYDGPAVPKKSQELTLELQGKDVYDVVQMTPKSDAPQPKKGKKTKNGKDTKPQEVANGHAQDDHVTNSSRNHVTPPVINADQEKDVKAKAKEASQGQTYAAVAFKSRNDKNKPEVRRNVKETEYSAVQFKTGPNVADEDSD